MPKHFPTLNALRAFEATARHLSFTRAAHELHLTQTAISHQIKELERLLGVQLFERRQNTISITSVGFDYLETIRPALGLIARASNRVSNKGTNTLHINCLTAFAVQCLLPALPEFCAAYPDIDIRITPVNAAEKAVHYDFDIGIWYGINTTPGLDVFEFANDVVFPVCSPNYWNGITLKKPDNLSEQTILRSLSPLIEDDWPSWLQHASPSKISFKKEICFDGLLLSVQAAIHGLGVCLGRAQLVQKELDAGRLIEPFNVRLHLETGYHIACQKEKTEITKIKIFREWILSKFGPSS